MHGMLPHGFHAPSQLHDRWKEIWNLLAGGRSPVCAQEPDNDEALFCELNQRLELLVICLLCSCFRGHAESMKLYIAFLCILSLNVSDGKKYYYEEGRYLENSISCEAAHNELHLWETLFQYNQY